MSLTPIQPSLMTHPAADKIEQGPISSLPDAIMLKIFSYLGALDVGRSSQVNRQWQALAKEDALWKPLISSIVFGAAKWSQYFGDVGVEPPLPSNIHQILFSPCPFWPGKRVYQTHLLTLIPQTVNGKRLTLQTLGELVKAPKQGNATRYGYFDIGKYIHLHASASHWVLMTRDIIEESRGKSYVEQEELVASYAQKTGIPYEVPNVLDAAVSIFLEYVRSGTYLYQDKPVTYTRCQEKYSKDTWKLDQLYVYVGCFSPDGLNVNGFYYSDSYGSFGVGCSRKF